MGKCPIYPIGRHVASDLTVLSGSGGPDEMETGHSDANGSGEDIRVPSGPEPQRAVGSIMA